jgi:hypothetical protein
MLLAGGKMMATEAVRQGVVDSAGDGVVEDVVAAAVAARGWDG